MYSTDDILYISPLTENTYNFIFIANFDKNKTTFDNLEPIRYSTIHFKMFSICKDILCFFSELVILML
jgi:hypothetical protein